MEYAENKLATGKKQTRIHQYFIQWRTSIILIVVSILFLLWWEYAASHEMISRLFFPAPSTSANVIAEWFSKGEIVVILVPSLLRLYIGFTIGAGLGVILGFVFGIIPILREIANPIIAFVHPIPKIAILPLIFIIFGFGEQSRVIVIGLSAFFPAIINTQTGVRQIESTYLAVAKIYKASWWVIFSKVLLPASMPYIVTGLRIAFNTAFTVTVSVELVAARDGLGRTLWIAWETLRTEDIYAGLLLIGVLSLGNNLILSMIESYLLRWQMND